MLAALSSTAAAGASQGTLHFEPCRIGDPPITVAAECSTLSVPFTHGMTAGTDTQSRHAKVIPEFLTLSIAKIPARSNRELDDPLIFLSGGPGQSATASWPQIQSAFYPILANRTVYLIDQRGTGNSARMDCAPADTGTDASIDLEVVEQASLQCYEDQTLPTEWFTTSVAVRDLETVRKSLGIEKWNLYGVSYGTRVALHYLRRYPQHTRSVILDAVVPPQKPLGPEIPVYAQQALDALFTRCQQDDDCSAAFPKLREKTNALFQALETQPQTVEFENVSRGTLESIQFSAHHLASTVRLMSYSSYGTAILPSMLYDAAHNNNLAPFARQVGLQLDQLDNALAAGMHSAVVCTEDAPFIKSSVDRALLEQTYLGDSILDTTSTTCNQWPMGVIDADFHEPVVSDVPVLALSGAVDPITPPDYAELAIQSLSNARHIVNKHQGHTQALLGCMPSVMSQFIEQASPENLNLDCLKRLSPPALFIDANGPQP